MVVGLITSRVLIMNETQWMSNVPKTILKMIMIQRLSDPTHCSKSVRITFIIVKPDQKSLNEIKVFFFFLISNIHLLLYICNQFQRQEILPYLSTAPSTRYIRICLLQRLYAFHKDKKKKFILTVRPAGIRIESGENWERLVQSYHMGVCCTCTV